MDGHGGCGWVWMGMDGYEWQWMATCETFSRWVIQKLLNRRAAGTNQD